MTAGLPVAGAVYRPRYVSVCLSTLFVAALVGCGSGRTAGTATAPNQSALMGYMAKIEPIRLGVNRLLERADPILHALREHRLGRAQAADQVGALERRFAGYAVDVASIDPLSSGLRWLHRGYAATYILEDAYLNALVSGLAKGDLAGLPHTQSVQRAAIIRWRVGLMVLARRLRLALPADLEAAGRGEIAPSPTGS